MKHFTLAFAAGLAFATSAAALSTTVGTDQGLVRPDMDNQGWWLENQANNNATNDNYITGAYSTGSRSYFTFDLSGLGGQTITGLTLNLRRYVQDQAVVLDFWDVSTSASDLAQRGVVDSAIWMDLGTGTSYGTSGVIPSGASTDVLSFSLNAAAVAGANAAVGGYFSIGASVNGPGVIFSLSSDEPGNFGPGYTQDLVIDYVQGQVPLPAAGWLLVTGLGGLVVARRKSRS